jgi:iron(III) transport system permease protein
MEQVEEKVVGPVGAIRRIEIQALLCTVVLAFVALFVLYPIVLIVFNSFQVARPGAPPLYGLDGWRVALSEPGMRQAVYNTFALLLTRQIISFPIAIFLAWLLARTDLPGKGWLEFMFWLSFFLPSLSVTLGWILVLDPEYGMANQLWNSLFGTSKGPFNIYSFWGIIWAHLGHNTTAVKVMLLTPAFRNMDASLEEASQASGASTFGTLARILIPIMTPALLVVLILAIITGLQAFEVELILGAPIGLQVYSTKIYNLINQEPPLFGPSTALSTVVLTVLFPLIVMQRWLIGRREYTTITGRYQPRPIRLGQWRYPAFGLVALVALLITVVPMGFLVTGTLMSLFGFFHIEDAWTLLNWRRVFNDQIFLNSLRNTLIMSGGAAILAVTLFSLIAYIVVRTKFGWRSVLDLISWLPSAVPGILMGIGLLWLFLDSPFLRPLYGSVWLLIIATVIGSTTLGTQIIKSNLLQLGAELEEASRTSGASWWATYRRVVIPLMFPTLVLVGVLSFIHAARDISTVALLATSSSRTLALLQLDFMVSGRYESAAVVATIVMLLTTGVAVIARTFGLRIGLRG